MIVWVCVKCTPEQIGYLLYTWYLIGFFLLVVGGSYIGQLACHLMDLDSDAVKFNVLMAQREFARSHSWKNKITLKRAKAVRPLKLKYGPFGTIGGAFFVNYVRVLLDRCFDTILIFDYK